MPESRLHVFENKILLVEDEPTNMAILSAYLRRAGYPVDEVGDGEAAWERLKAESKYAVVVTDRRMPKLDGLELFKRMSQDDALQHIPVIMQTGAKAPEEVAEGVKAGVYYYLTKPYREDVLLSLVSAAIRSRQQQDMFEQRFTREQDALNKTFVSGEFAIVDPNEALNIALLLGGLFPRPELAATGLHELLLNAIEHGNLGIGFAAKAKLLVDNQWEQEIERRLAAPEAQGKKVSVHFKRLEDRTEVLITDAGPGFDWRPFLQIEPSRATQGNGRGIAKANLMCFDQLAFQGSGNAVRVSSNLDDL